MQIIFVLYFNQMDRVLGQYTWHWSGNLLGMFENMVLKIVGWDAHWRLAQTVMPLSYLTTETAMYTLKMDEFAHNSLRTLLRKMFGSKLCTFLPIFTPALYSAYSFGYDFNILIMMIWIIFLKDGNIRLKVATKIVWIYLRGTLRNVYSKYQQFIMEISCIWLYILLRDDVHYTYWVSIKYAICFFKKWSDICIKWHLSHKQRSVVWLICVNFNVIYYNSSFNFNRIWVIQSDNST